MGGLSSSDYALWCQAVAILISAAAAIWLVLSSRGQSKKRATVEMLLNMRLDSDYIKLRNAFTELLKQEENLGQYASSDGIQSETGMLIFRVLNYHEFLATGISENAFDENIYKRMSYTSCMRDWSRLKGFVHELRVKEKSNTLFQEFECLAHRWKDEPLKEQRSN